MNTLLKIDGLKKNFGKTKVLKGIELNIREGEIISVLGPSGCGKSTMLRIIAGILPLDDGTISIRNHIVSDKKKEVPTEKRDINMVFQDFALWPHMKVRDNIIYGLKIRKIQESEIEKRLQELEALLHIGDLMMRFPSELSGGQQQRVAIARALITKPSIVLLDEPLCNLDIQLRVEMRTEMAYLFHRLGTTVLHVTHDPSEAFALADRIIIMNKGQIDQIDTPKNCYKYPKTKTVAALLGASNKVKAVVCSITGQTIVAKINSDTVICKSFSEHIKVGDFLELKFRPESAVFSEDADDNVIPIKAIVSTFEGNCYRIKAETSAGDAISFLNESSIPSDTSGYLKIDDEVLYGYEWDEINL